MNILLEPSWKEKLTEAYNQPGFIALTQFLKAEKAAGKIIYPPGPLMFNAFALTPLTHVKVVILGQDPYHGAGQAHGLSFSVPTGVRPPPSLQNMFKELHDDLGIPLPQTGNLEPWAKQGVFLLNTILSVQANMPASHQNKGWEAFTDAVIRLVNTECTHVVFMLWGKHAQAKASLINPQHHLILKAPHPSPFSAHTGFLGCKHFSACNQYLVQNGKTPIHWQLP